MVRLRTYLSVVFGGMVPRSVSETCRLVKFTERIGNFAQHLNPKPFLLLMDDNHRLVEWLPHHFHVSKLRTLIATTDPRSQTSPTAIFNKWRAHGMNIIEWSESHLEIQVDTPNNSNRQLDYLELDYLTLSPKRTTKIL